MEIVKATSLGFCNGVSFAIGKVEQCLALAKEHGLPAYSCGEFIHNRHVMEHYQRQGLQVIAEPEGHRPGYVVVRAHGIPDALRTRFETAGYSIIDGTCPTVARSQMLIRKASAEGRHIVIIGLHQHDETVALAGCEVASGILVDSTIVESVEELEHVPEHVPLLVMVQTTFPESPGELIYQALTTGFQDRDIVYGNRICPSSVIRRKAVEKLCDDCDAVIVVGSSNSANTQALVEIVRQRNLPVWLVPAQDEVPEDVCGYSRIGLTAGASAPPEVVSGVEARLRTIAAELVG